MAEVGVPWEAEALEVLLEPESSAEGRVEYLEEE